MAPRRRVPAIRWPSRRRRPCCHGRPAAPWSSPAGQIQPLRCRIRSPRLVPGLRAAVPSSTSLVRRHLRLLRPPPLTSAPAASVPDRGRTTGSLAVGLALPRGPAQPPAAVGLACSRPWASALRQGPVRQPRMDRGLPCAPPRPSFPPACPSARSGQPQPRLRLGPSPLEFRKRSECEDSYDYVGSSSSRIRSSSKRDLSCRYR